MQILEREGVEKLLVILFDERIVLLENENHKFYKLKIYCNLMRIIPFDEQGLEDRCVVLDGPNIDPKAYAGQDSVVFRDVRTDRAIHVYHCGEFEGILAYARCVNAAASALDGVRFEEEVDYGGRRFKVGVRVNPVEEVGERLFGTNGESLQRAYTVSPFIGGLSLCWPQQAEDDEQRAVARCFNMFFYDRVDEFIAEQSGVQMVDINPVNVKYNVEEAQQRISLVITDLAKSVLDVH